MTDVATLLEKTIEILRMEINTIYTKAASAKLSEELSKDLVNYIKLLSSLEDRQQKALEAMEHLDDKSWEALIKNDTGTKA